MSAFRFDCVFYYVSELDRAIAFYTTVLGFELAPRDARRTLAAELRLGRRTVLTFPLLPPPAPGELRPRIEPGLGKAEAVELARALGQLPPRLVIYGIEGEDFGMGEGLTPAVAAAVEGVAADVVREVAS